MQQSTLVVVMGPSGSGKSLIGSALADAIEAPFLEGDDFHTRANVAKMASGKPLSDADRSVWLNEIEKQVAKERSSLIILACSALTDYVQMRLRSMPVQQVRFVHLEATKDVLAQRIKDREGHFMPLSLLDSQLEALRTPHDALVLDAGEDVAILVSQALTALGEGGQEKSHRKTHKAH